MYSLHQFLSGINKFTFILAIMTNGMTIYFHCPNARSVKKMSHHRAVDTQDTHREIVKICFKLSLVVKFMLK